MSKYFLKTSAIIAILSFFLTVTAFAIDISEEETINNDAQAEAFGIQNLTEAQDSDSTTINAHLTTIANDIANRSASAQHTIKIRKNPRGDIIVFAKADRKLFVYKVTPGTPQIKSSQINVRNTRLVQTKRLLAPLFRTRHSTNAERSLLNQVRSIISHRTARPTETPDTNTPAETPDTTAEPTAIAPNSPSSTQTSIGDSRTTRQKEIIPSTRKKLKKIPRPLDRVTKKTPQKQAGNNKNWLSEANNLLKN